MIWGGELQPLSAPGAGSALSLNNAEDKRSDHAAAQHSQAIVGRALQHRLPRQLTHEANIELFNSTHGCEAPFLMLTNITDSTLTCKEDVVKFNAFLDANRCENLHYGKWRSTHIIMPSNGPVSSKVGIYTRPHGASHHRRGAVLAAMAIGHSHV